MPAEFEMRLARNYANLSETLRRTGDYIARHPIDTASRSLRTVATDAGVAPASFSRLARALGYGSFDDLRDSLRLKIGKQVQSFADRAQEIGPGSDFAHTHLAACQNNLASLARDLDYGLMNATAGLLHQARRVYVFGALGATGITEYLSYLAHFCAENWTLLGRQGTSLGSKLVDIGKGDVLLVITKHPYSPEGLRVSELAAAQEAEIAMITDNHACPALQYARYAFIVPTVSPHFYSSYVATLALIEILIGMLVGRAGGKARDRIGRIEQANRRLDEVWDG